MRPTKPPVNVLLVENDPSRIEGSRRALQDTGHEIELECVDTGVAMQAALDRTAFGLVLCRVGLSTLDASSALDLTRAMGREIPLVLLCSEADEATAVSLVRQGARDYVLDSHPARLAPALERELRDLQTRRDRQRAEQALRRETQGRRILMDGSLDGICVINQRHEVVEANQRFADMLGYSREEVLRLHTWDWEASMNEAQIREEFADLTTTGVVFETRHRRKDGTTYEVEVSAAGSMVDSEPLVFTISRDITRRKQAEEALRTSEAFLNGIIEQSPYPMWISDDQGILLRLNQACRDLLHVKDDEVVGKYCVLKDPVVADQGFMPVMRGVYERGEAARFELDYDTSRLSDLPLAERTHVILAVTAFPVRDVHDRITHAVIQHVDITERRRAEDALRESEESFRRTFEQAAVGMSMVAADGSWIRVNQRLCDIVGYTRAALMQRTLRDMTHPDDLAADSERVQRMLAGERDFDSWEKRYVRGDGRVIWVRLTTSVYRAATGAQDTFITVTEDITERKRSEQALAESEERFRGVFEGVADGILVSDLRGGRIVMANRAMGTMLGHSPEQLLKLRVDDVCPGLSEARADGAGADGSRLAKAASVRRRDGSTLFADVRSVPLQFGDRHCQLSVYRDTTEISEMEAQMRQAQKIEAVGRLAGGVAHDFNNILGVIMGHCELALAVAPQSGPLFESLDQIHAGTQRAAALTRQLLAFSRKQTLEPKVLDLNATVRGLQSMVERLIGEDVELTTQLAPDLGLVKADPGQVEQVIVNLVVNARDAMPQGGRLAIGTANVEVDEAYAMEGTRVAAGSYVRVAVTDTGVGLTPSIKEHLFEPFFTTKEKGKGTGLGLSTAYGIVKQSGGYIWASGEPGVGSTFEVYLPQTREALPERGFASTRAPGRGNGESILIVEDEPALRGVVREALALLGYRAAVAANGAEALKMVEADQVRPDLVVTDVVMPGMSGPTLAARLRHRLPGLKVILMSGYAGESIAQHGLPVADASFIQKPFKVRDLATRVWQLLHDGEDAPEAGPG